MVEKDSLYQPVYKQFISNIEKGFLLLDKASQTEMVDFVKSQQHKIGAFCDRAGTSDIYYSLFGAWISNALNLQAEQTALNQFILTVHENELKITDKFSLLLIQLSIAKNDFKKPTLFSLIRWIFNEGRNLNTAYRFFLFMLSFDALFGRDRLVYFGVKVFLSFYWPTEDLPCSFYSALLLAKFLTGKKVKKETKILMDYFEQGNGFKVYPEQKYADLLSTAVALFALKTVGTDLRVVTPDCLNLVQENYENGAFLSGDGDLSRDLEYTFYGLLTLGILS